MATGLGDNQMRTWTSNTLTLDMLTTNNTSDQVCIADYEHRLERLTHIGRPFGERLIERMMMQLSQEQYDYQQLIVGRIGPLQEREAREQQQYDWLCKHYNKTFATEYPAEFIQEKKPMRALWKVYVVDIKTEETWEFQVIATDEGKAKIKASWKWANVQPGRGDNLDNLDLFAVKIGTVRDADGDK